jgi:hypothetical protein
MKSTKIKGKIFIEKGESKPGTKEDRKIAKEAEGQRPIRQRRQRQSEWPMEIFFSKSRIKSVSED